MAVDFETANADRGSACAIGIVTVSGGQISHQLRRLIRPYDLRFDPYNISIHGITPQDVESEPNMNELWPEVSGYFRGLPVVAHNASFDMSVLRYALDHFHIDYPSVDYVCTRLLSQRIWPGLVSYSLVLVARHLGIEFNHHDPCEDARVCAQIVLQAAMNLGLDDLRELATVTGAGLGHLAPGGYYPPHCSPLRSREARRPTEPVAAAQPDPNHPFFGKTVVFTGTLQSMSRREAWAHVESLGGMYLDSMNRSVDFLVVGDLDFRTFQSGHTKSIKIRKAEELVAQGKSIEILSEDDFLRLL